METPWKFIRSGAVSLAVIEDSELPEIHGLMSRYSDRPMDFADATLVYLARREGLSTVFTVDRADFGVYRIRGRKRFRILPEAKRPEAGAVVRDVGPPAVGAGLGMQGGQS